MTSSKMSRLGRRGKMPAKAGWRSWYASLSQSTAAIMLAAIAAKSDGMRVPPPRLGSSMRSAGSKAIVVGLYMIRHWTTSVSMRMTVSRSCRVLFGMLNLSVALPALPFWTSSIAIQARYIQARDSYTADSVCLSKCFGDKNTPVSTKQEYFSINGIECQYGDPTRGKLEHLLARTGALR